MEENIFNINCGALKMFSDFSKKSGEDIKFQYVHNHPRYEELKEKYKIEEIAGEGDELSKAINMLNWVFENNYHDGNSDGVEPFNSLTLLDYSYGKGEKNGIACFGLAIILSECLLALEIKARVIHLLPFNPYDFDSHVVTIAYINKLNKWIMLDPTHNCYFLDENKNILAPWEIREVIASGGKVVCNKEVAYNDKEISYEDLNKQLTYYMAKNTFYMFTNLINTFNCEMFPTKFGYLKEQKNIYLCPNGFNPYNHRIENALYRIKLSGEDEELLEYLKFLKETSKNHIVADFDTFIKKPY